ncbi:MAG: ImmA/IrrE family metallo-endopeptidase [Planctomycetaceae bacterium]|nr:ImmA/IrrE family metallo-endopeptidase [Planctomycetaceae bacterium]
MSKLFAQHPAALTTPVPIDLLVELEGANLDIMRGLTALHGIHGATMKDVETGEIWVLVDDRLADEGRSLNRYRSTIAEELGHMILHREIIDQVSTVDDFRIVQRHPEWWVVERNAKKFAACVLMPAQHVIRASEELYPQLVRVAGYGHPEAILKHLASLLAKRFEVSPESMTYRLREWPVNIEDRVRSGINAQLDYLPS